MTDRTPRPSTPGSVPSRGIASPAPDSTQQRSRGMMMMAPTTATSSTGSSSRTKNEVAPAGTFVVNDAIVAMAVVEGGRRSHADSTHDSSSSSSSSSSALLHDQQQQSMMMRSTVWTADESGWIRVRDPTNGDVMRQWRTSTTGSNNNNNSSDKMKHSGVAVLWASPRRVPSQFAVVLAGREDGAISVYSAASAAHIADLALHEGLVSSFVACDPDAVYVASSSFDGRVAVWDTRNLRCVTSVVCNKLDRAAQLCMAAFPVARDTWWLASGGHGGSFFAHRAPDLTPVGHQLVENHANPDSLFAMTAMLCASSSRYSASSASGSDEDDFSTKHIWCGFSDGTVSIFSASLAAGIERVQTFGMMQQHNKSGGSSSEQCAVSHLSNPGEDRVWVFTVDGYMTIFDAIRRVVLQRLPASPSAVASSSSSSSLSSSMSPAAAAVPSPAGHHSHSHHNNNNNNNNTSRRRDLLTCVAPVSVSRVWKVWTASDDGSVRVWVSQTPDPRISDEPPKLHAVPMQEVELLREKLSDARRDVDRATEKEESTRKMAKLDMEENMRRCEDEIRKAEMARVDAVEQLESQRASWTAVERDLKDENRRLEQEIQRLHRRSVDRASSVPRSGSVSNNNNNNNTHSGEPPSSSSSSSSVTLLLQQQVDSLKEQLAEAHTRERAAFTTAISAVSQQVQSPQRPQQQQQQQQQQSSSGDTIESVRAELLRATTLLARQEDKMMALTQEMERRTVDYEKTLEVATTLRSSLEEAVAKTVKADEQCVFLRKELARAQSGGMTSPISKVDLLGSRQDGLESLEQQWLERSSAHIRESHDLRQQLDHKTLEVKALDNELRVARSDIDGLREELRTALDGNAALEREREDDVHVHERAVRDARAEERRATEAEVAQQYRARMVDIEKDLQAAMDRSAKLESELRFTQDELRTMEKRREATVQRDTAHLQELQKMLAASTEQLKAKEAETGRMQATHENAIQELRSEVMAAQREAEGQKRAREGLEAAARRQLSLVSTEMNAVDADVQQLHRQLADGSVVIQRAALQDELSAVKEQLAHAQRELASRRTSSVHLESEYNQMESRLLVEKSETNRAKAECEALQRQAQIHRDEMAALQIKLAAAQREEANAIDIAEKRFKVEVEASRAQLAQAGADNVRLRTEADMLNKKLVEETSRNSTTLIEKQATFAKEKAELVAKLEAAEREISSGTVTQQMATWQRRLEDSVTERESLRETVTTLRKQLDQAERTSISMQTESERQIQEMRRANMFERNESAAKMAALELDMQTQKAVADRLKDQVAEHARECPLRDSSVAQLITEKKRLQSQLDDATERETKMIAREQALKTDLATTQSEMANKEFEHVRELKVLKLEHDAALDDAVAKAKLNNTRNSRTSSANVSSSMMMTAVARQQQQHHHQQSSSSMRSGGGSGTAAMVPDDIVVMSGGDDDFMEEDDFRRRLRRLRDENDDLERKHRREQKDAEELRDKIKELTAKLEEAQAVQTQQQQKLAARGGGVNAETATRMRDQIVTLQKEKAAVQMQLMKRDDQMKEFETKHVSRMLEEVNALRLARDKAL